MIRSVKLQTVVLSESHRQLLFTATASAYPGTGAKLPGVGAGCTEVG